MGRSASRMNISISIAVVLLVLVVAAETIWIERDTWRKWLAIRTIQDDDRF
jgi:hypothetical protein